MKKLTDFKVLTFDVVGTLINFERSEEHTSELQSP